MSIIRKLKDVLRYNNAVFAVTHTLYKAYRAAVMGSMQRIHGIAPKKVVFGSFMESAYSDNPRYISEKLHELCPEAEIVWLFRENVIREVSVPDYVRKVTPISWKGLREQATARFWVDNFRRSESLYLNDRKQYYINTWHGDRGFKRVGDDNEKLRRYERRLETRCAMMIAGSEFGRNTYRTAFHYQGEVLMDGCPRNDLLLRNDPSVAAQIRKRLGIDSDIKLLLYAPTYRDNLTAAQDAAVDISATLDHLEARTGKHWMCLYRAHYLSGGLKVRPDGRVKDMSRWPEMAELLLVSDMLITDYSSCGSDFVLLRRPMFLYQADEAEYLSLSRSFYFDIRTSPFLVARSQAELEALIDETDAEKARQNGEVLDAFFGTTETGRASEAVCRYIMDRMGPEKTLRKARRAE